MKIIRLSTLLDFGGIESKMANLATHNDANEWIFCSIGKGGIASNKIAINNKKVKCFDISYKIPSIKTILKLYNYFKTEKPTVVHCSGSEANFHGAIAAKLANVPLIIAEEIGIPSHSKTAIYIFNFVYKLCNYVVGESQIVVENLKSVYKIKESKLKVVSNFTLFTNTNSQNLDDKSEVFKILTVSRLEFVKNIEGIIKVIHQLKQEKIKIKYTIVGDGSIKNDLEHLVSKLNLENEIEFIGFTENTTKYYQETNLYILNSFSEGFSNSLLEAMYFKKPVISSNVGAALEIIKNNYNGWIIDNENELFSKIKNSINLSADTRNEIGNNAHKTIVENFSLQSHIANLLKLYNLKK